MNFLDAADFTRGPRRTDQSYIAATWIKQLASADRKSAIGARYGAVGRNVDAVLDRADTRCLIHHAPGDEHAIYGYIVYAEGPGVPLVHMTYVRKDYRGKGIATSLLQRIGVGESTSFVYTCIAPGTRHMLRRYKLATYFNLSEFLS